MNTVNHLSDILLHFYFMHLFRAVYELNHELIRWKIILTFVRFF